MSASVEKAAVWFEERAKNTPMPGARGMFEMAAAALREKVEREAKPQTNADRIRAMSDEELAEWLGEHLDCINCPVGVTCVHGNGCPGSLVDWLQQTAEE